MHTHLGAHPWTVCLSVCLSVCLFRLAVDRQTAFAFGWQPHGLFYPTCCSSGCLLSSHASSISTFLSPPFPSDREGNNSCYTNASCILYPSLILCNPIRPQGGGRGIPPPPSAHTALLIIKNHQFDHQPVLYTETFSEQQQKTFFPSFPHNQPLLNTTAPAAPPAASTLLPVPLSFPPGPSHGSALCVLWT